MLIYDGTAATFTSSTNTFTSGTNSIPVNTWEWRGIWNEHPTTVASNIYFEIKEFINKLKAGYIEEWICPYYYDPPLKFSQMLSDRWREYCRRKRGKDRRTLTMQLDF